MSWRTVSDALSAPGTDPRKWVEVGTVVAVLSDDTGLYCDCELADGSEVRARVMVLYGGVDTGIEVPYHEGDEVVLGFPEGNPDLAIVLGCLHTAKAIKPASEGKLLVKAKDDEAIEVIAKAGTKVTSDTEVDGTLQVDKATDLKATLDVGGATTLKAQTTVQGNLTLLAGLIVGGQPGFSGSVIVTTPSPPYSATLVFVNGVLTQVT